MNNQISAKCIARFLQVENLLSIIIDNLRFISNNVLFLLLIKISLSIKLVFFLIF